MALETAHGRGAARPGPLPAPLAVGVLLAGSLLAACRGATEPSVAVQALERPSARSAGPRLPEAVGPVLSTAWRCIEGVAYLPVSEFDAYASGRVRGANGEELPREGPLPPGTAPASGHRVRTAHTVLRTDRSWPQALEAAREAEAHVERLFALLGEAAGLHFPSEPLPILLSGRRRAFEAAIADLVVDPSGWGAWYDAITGTVHVTSEPTDGGSLPMVANLRHEMTHQVLDLSSPKGRRYTIFRGRGLWLWEGIAIWSEGLGGGAGAQAAPMRAERFAVRRRRGEVERLDRLLTLSAEHLEGRHYDQLGSLFAVLMDGRVPGGRAAVMESLRDLLRGSYEDERFFARLGLTPAELERRWLASTP